MSQPDPEDRASRSGRALLREFAAAHHQKSGRAQIILRFRWRRKLEERDSPIGQ